MNMIGNNWPPLVKAMAEKCADLGLFGSYDSQHPLIPKGRHIQVRDEENLVSKNSLASIVIALKAGVTLPPLVATSDSYLVDGNTRTAGATKIGNLTAPTFVLYAKWSDGKNVQGKLRLLGAMLNIGPVPLTDKEVENTINFSTTEYSVDELSKALGWPLGKVEKALWVAKAQVRIKDYGLVNKGVLKDTIIAKFGSSNLHQDPFEALFNLAQDARLNAADLSAVIAKVKNLSDKDAVAHIEGEREGRKDQIENPVSKFKPRKKANLHNGAKLKKNLSILDIYDLDTFIEKNPVLEEETWDDLQEKISLLMRLSNKYRVNGIEITDKWDLAANVY